MTTLSPKHHIEQMRRSKFSIGGDANPLTQDLHQAVKNLSAELYAKDVHFLMELIQNAEDNEYLEDVDPSLEFVITAKDITRTGAPATLLIFNNEKGFSAKHIESVCSVGRSTKKGNRKRGYIGEKGIGFKSVFLITSQPHIFSNGYHLKFDEAPCPHCSLGYIVPEWVESLTLPEIQKIYGSAFALPTTTIVLPLKADKVKAVKQQLSSIHPEVLLFLSKIKRLSVKEDTEDPRLGTLSAISILRETNMLQRKNIDAESYTLYLSADKNCNNSEAECSYYMWKQKFPVRHENKVDKRMEAEELVITLAFPNGERLCRDVRSLPGVYAFLPTEMVTNFPFIIQSDFILSSSREYILFDNKWNKGILDCVPTAFINALTALVKGTTDAPLSNIPRMFKFLPINESTYKELNAVRESIRAKLIEEHIVPSESYTGQKLFHKSCDVARIMPTFWDILKQARVQGLSLQNLSSHGCYILNSSFDKAEYDHILEFLGVKPVGDEWYAKCIQGSDIAASVSDEVYLKLLLFLANGWNSKFGSTLMKSIPLIKYVGLDGNVSLCSIQKSANSNGFLVCMASNSDHSSWLINWNKVFTCGGCYYVPEITQKVLTLSTKREKILQWLRDQARVSVLSVSGYADVICDTLSDSQNPIIAYGHFLYHSFWKKYLSDSDVRKFSGKMPLLDSYGNVITNRKGVLVPASGSKWAGLIGSNPWRGEGYVELGEDYLRPSQFAGQYTPKEELIKFLKSHVAASDVPKIFPPNAVMPAASSPLTKQNAFLLLDWIQYLKRTGTQIPENFMISIKKGSWLRVITGGSYGYRPPSQSFHLAKSWGDILQNGSVLVDIPLIDKSFYGDKIEEYKEVLKAIGVMFDHEEAYAFIGKHFMSMASSSLTRANVFSILNFIKFLRERMLSPDKLISSIKEGRWLRTLHGERYPRESVLFSEDWKVPSQISDVPFIDRSYYGEKIILFETELQLLDVVIGFNDRYKLVIDHLKSPSHLTSLTPEALLLLLKCLSQKVSPTKICNSLKGIKCLKTDCGYKSPSECFLYDPVWGCLLKVFNSVPLIEQNFYGGSILQYKNELEEMGVVVDFNDAVKQFVSTFKQHVSLSSLTTQNVLSFLSSYRQLKRTLMFPSDFMQCIREQKWLRTRLGDYRSPKDCILYNSDWESISQITTLPFIADTDSYYGRQIHEYRNELKGLGVVVEFKAGVKFVFSGLSFSKDASYLSRSVALSLLECIRLQEANVSLPVSFLNKVSQIWLKTHIGYKHPEECLLFDSKWGSHLEKTDGPFIDEGVYGTEITSYKEELKKIGVTVDIKEGCSLISSHIDVHSTLSTIIRIYNYLSEFNWQPEDSGRDHRIWIPNGTDKGKWVSPDECVLHDKDELFTLQLHVLDKHYSVNLLGYFSKAVCVESNPSVDDYCKLWKGWESSKEKLSLAECCSFWGYISKNCSSKVAKTLAKNMMKMPASSSSDGILLLDKRDVYIADDLLLKDLFEKDSHFPLFVWYPPVSKSSLSMTEMTEIYKKIGVRTISESVYKKELSVLDDAEIKEVNSKDTLVKKGLAKIIIGFLSDPLLNMGSEKRQEAVKCLLNLTVFETSKPIELSYSLSLSSGKTIDVKASRNIRWDRENSKLYVQKMDRAEGYRNLVEHATYFSEVISEGVLWENEQCTGALAELIKLAFVLEFNEQAVGFILKKKNVPISLEDEEFLSSVFP